MKTIYYSLFVFLLSSATIWGQCENFTNSIVNIHYSSNNCNGIPPSSTATICATFNINLTSGNASYQLGYTINGVDNTITLITNCNGCSYTGLHCVSVPCNSLVVFYIDTWSNPNGNGIKCTRLQSSGFNPDGTLPLADTKFTAIKNSSAVNISWEANDDAECLGYELENSIDGSVWKALIWKSNTQPRVTTTYIATDNSTYTGVIYYRLKRVLADGSSDYSKVISVGNNAAVVVAPNPASDVVTLLPGKEVDIEMLSIFDAKGNLIQKLSHPSKTLSIEELIPGLYFFQLETIESSYTQKIYIQE